MRDTFIITLRRCKRGTEISCSMVCGFLCTNDAQNCPSSQESTHHLHGNIIIGQNISINARRKNYPLHLHSSLLTGVFFHRLAPMGISLEDVSVPPSLRRRLTIKVPPRRGRTTGSIMLSSPYYATNKFINYRQTFLRTPIHARVQALP